MIDAAFCSGDLIERNAIQQSEIRLLHPIMLRVKGQCTATSVLAPRHAGAGSLTLPARSPPRASGLRECVSLRLTATCRPDLAFRRN